MSVAEASGCQYDRASMALSSFGRSLLALVVFLAACTSGHVKRGALLYSEGRYIEAAEVFEQTEYLLEDSDTRERAEYAAYRGLTLLGLGDLRQAHRWMAYAYQIEALHPGSLRPEERERLDQGWSDLGERMQRTPELPTSPGTALAASQPPPPLNPPQIGKPPPTGPALP